jgi:large subunit ribosomal protein L25
MQQGSDKMDFAKVNVEVRTQSGKGSARKARALGKCPAVLYGHKQAPVSLTIDPLLLIKSLDKERKRNTVFSLSVASDGKSEDVTAMIRDVQVHPLSRAVVHVDFIRVSLDEEIKVLVPLHLKGTAVGTVNGGNLHQSMHELPVAAKPQAIPSRIELDVSALNIGDALHASDIKLGEGVRVLLDPKEAVASVVAPRAEKEAEAAAAVPAEGAAAAPAEGAAAAAPAAGGDKAAPAAAAGGDKKGGGEKKGK